MGAASQELTDRAKLLISERRYQDAVRACRRALLSKPGQVEIRLLLGEALLALERYDEVRVEMMALARKVPDRGPVYRLLGEAYLRNGRPKQAVDALEKALELDPNDEVAEELLAEAADEKAPISTTIERWFADEAEPTIEMESPAWTEEATPVPGATHPAALVVEEPSIQVDPSLVEEALSSRPKTTVATPRKMRARMATILGAPSAAPQLSPAPPKDAPLPPPPQPGAPPPRAEPIIEAPRGPPPSAPPPARPDRSTPLGDSPFVSSPSPSSPTDGELTRAATPSARRVVAEPATEEIDLEEVISEELEVRPLEGIPTRARSNEMPASPSPQIVPGLSADPLYAGDGHVTQDIEEIDDDSPTAAFSSPIDAGALEGEPTRANQPASGTLEPPTLDHFPAPRYEDTPYAESPPDPAPPERSIGGGATPAASSDRLREPSPHGVKAKIGRRRAKRSWLLPAVGGGAGLLVFGGLVVFGVSMYMSSEQKQEIRAAAASAGDNGAREELEAVVAQIGDASDEELLALEARLLATLTFEHDQDHGAEVQRIVGALTAEEALTDAAVASALVALAAGDPQAAERTLSGLTAQGEQIPEAFRARAYAMAALGHWPEAEEAARAAADARPTAPRHIAFHAITKHRNGETVAALTLLAGIPDGEHQPAVRVARARILVDSGSDPAQAVQEASVVIDDLASRATPQQLSWAHLIRAMYAAAEGQSEDALTEARVAAAHPPRLDESFGMELARVFLRAGAAEEADEHLSRLPEVIVDRTDRALLSAEVALAVGDLDRAEQALGQAGAGTLQNLLRARIFEARGQVDAARPLYQRAMRAHGPERRQAAIRLASIEMNAGHGDRVVNLLEPIHPEAIDDLELVPLLARAYLMRDRPVDARRVIDAALRRRPRSAPLNAVRGAVLLYQGDAEAALAPLRTAAAARPRDAALHADLGRAAHLAGHDDEARTAWGAALESDAANARALIGLGQLAFAANDFDRARTRVAAAAERGGEELAIAQLRGQLLVVRGAGAEGVDVVRPLSRRHADAIVWTSLGHLYAQAERDREADRAYVHALDLDEDSVDALLGRSLVQTRRGNLTAARRAIDRVVAIAGRADRAAAVAARVAVARGRLEFEDGDYAAAVNLGNEAVRVDEHLASAHLLLGTVAIERGSDALEHLRRAAAGHAPPPEALGQLAPRLPLGDEACGVARRYILAAPRGYDAPDVRRVINRCN